MTDEAMVEAVALAAINDRRGRHGWPPMNTIPEGFHNADEWRAQARAAIRALFPLIIERCAEEVEAAAMAHARAGGQMVEARAVSDAALRVRIVMGIATVNATRALAAEESEQCALAGVTSPPR